MKLAKVSLEVCFGKIQAPLNLLETHQSLVETGFGKIAERRGYFSPEVLDRSLKIGKNNPHIGMH